jgi:hypothetical protein
VPLYVPQGLDGVPLLVPLGFNPRERLLGFSALIPWCCEAAGPRVGCCLIRNLGGGAGEGEKAGWPMAASS